MSDKKIEYWFKLSYDADAKIRLKAAKELSSYPESPTAVFAVYELTYDKDEKVKETAKKIINSWKDNETEIIPLGEILAEKMDKARKIEEGKDKEEENERREEIKKRLMPTLEKYFQSEDSKNKLMPSLEKLFERLVEVEMGGHKTFEVKKPQEKTEEKTQKSLFDEEEEIEMPPEYKDYLATLSEIDRIAFAPSTGSGKQKLKIKKIKKNRSEDEIEEMIKEAEEETEEEDSTIPTEDSFEKIIYKKAFKLYITPGLTQTLINQELQ
ncbi:MAG: hypothetical protein WC356_05905, partial [Candidatus Micrarchaeia archaeon]